MSFGRIETDDGYEHEGEPKISRRRRLLEQSHILSWAGAMFLEPEKLDGLAEFLFEDTLEREDEQGKLLDAQYGGRMFLLLDAAIENLGIDGSEEGLPVLYEFKDPEEGAQAGVRRVWFSAGKGKQEGSMGVSVLETEEYFFAQREDGKWCALVIETTGSGKVTFERFYILDHPDDGKVFDREESEMFIERDENSQVVQVGVTNHDIEFNGLKGKEFYKYSLTEGAGADRYRVTGYYFDGVGQGVNELSHVGVYVDWDNRFVSISDKRFDVFKQRYEYNMELFGMKGKKMSIDLADVISLDMVRNFGVQRWSRLVTELAYKSYSSEDGSIDPEVHVGGSVDRLNLRRLDNEERDEIMDSVFAAIVDTWLEDEGFLEEEMELLDEAVMGGSDEQVGESEEFEKELVEDGDSGFVILEARFVTLGKDRFVNKLYLLVDASGDLVAYRYVKE